MTSGSSEHVGWKDSLRHFDSIKTKEHTHKCLPAWRYWTQEWQTMKTTIQTSNYRMQTNWVADTKKMLTTNTIKNENYRDLNFKFLTQFCYRLCNQTLTKYINHTGEKHLPGSSKETCNLISEACVVGMLHDSHQLNTIVTWIERAEKNIILNLKRIHVFGAFPTRLLI